MKSGNELWLACTERAARGAATVLVAAAVAVLSSGCLGSADDPAVAGRTEVLVQAPELPVLSYEQWSTAPAGCEDLVGEDTRLGVAEGAPPLVGVLGSEGSVTCVDTFDAIERDLLALGERGTAERLRDSYVLTIHDPHALVDSASGAPEGDPSPQPNTEASARGASLIGGASLLAGVLDSDGGSDDPSPQPNDSGPDESDPSPQPN